MKKIRLDGDCIFYFFDKYMIITSKLFLNISIKKSKDSIDNLLNFYTTKDLTFWKKLFSFHFRFGKIGTKLESHQKGSCYIPSEWDGM